MRTAFLVLALAAYLIKPIAAQTVTGLPLHSMDPQDLAGLHGAFQLVPGETVRWYYEFEWSGTAADGRRIPIPQTSYATFLGAVGGGYRLSLPGQPPCVVTAPPNSRSTASSDCRRPT